MSVYQQCGFHMARILSPKKSKLFYMHCENNFSFCSNLASFIHQTTRHLPHLALVIHLQHSLAPNGNFPGSSPLLLAELSLRPLVAEHLHLQDSLQSVKHLR